jgi:hypothetical protein
MKEAGTLPNPSHHKHISSQRELYEAGGAEAAANARNRILQALKKDGNLAKPIPFRRSGCWNKRLFVGKWTEFKVTRGTKMRRSSSRRPAY